MSSQLPPGLTFTKINNSSHHDSTTPLLLFSSSASKSDQESTLALKMAQAMEGEVDEAMRDMKRTWNEMAAENKGQVIVKK
ncbi:hypothetical protein HZ326_27869 [Fusarium oxysporum f. sp. albedinis]|nr:hypothetical protein HZ326_27869 [Fusarium oxysporum f. sp. albedinis]KAK2483030.1 hypothetical protein H9L39_04822 [Fusarium oxysporum f. sp. albedinis]